MFIYELYRSFIKEGYGELYEYIAFLFLSILCISIDIILSPLEIIAFIMWKLGGSNELER